jgi:hypothetical protein
VLAPCLSKFVLGEILSSVCLQEESNWPYCRASWLQLTGSADEVSRHSSNVTLTNNGLEFLIHVCNIHDWNKHAHAEPSPPKSQRRTSTGRCQIIFISLFFFYASSGDTSAHYTFTILSCFTKHGRACASMIRVQYFTRKNLRKPVLVLRTKYIEPELFSTGV